VQERSRPSRRVGRIAVALGLVIAAASLDLTAITAPAHARTDAPTTVDPGFGQAQAQMLMIDPRSAGLSFGVRFGPTVADHRHVVARATAQSTDAGLIGSALTSQGCAGTAPPVSPDQLPKVLRADSRTPGDANEKTVSEGPITQSVLARDDPYAQARSRLAEVDVPALFTLAGATDETTSGVDADGRPRVTAEVRIAKLSLMGGLVQLDGLRWYAQQVGGQAPTGSFTIGSGSIGGKTIPTQDASAVVRQVNTLLQPIGLALTPPRSHRESDTFFVDPLAFGIDQNPTRDQVTAALLQALQPVREQLFAALIAANCNFKAAITVVDILLGSASGAGSFTFDVGGAQAQLLKGADDDGPTTTVATAVDESLPPIGDTGLPLSGPSGGRPEVSVPNPGLTPLGPRRAAQVGKASDGALAVGLVTVGLGLLLVDGDRRKMRRAAAAPSSTPEVPAP
jgi:hypothetical protein